eukprot:5078029-Lingulodinium_polyedra.AAC.1
MATREQLRGVKRQPAVRFLWNSLLEEQAKGKAGPPHDGGRGHRPARHRGAGADTEFLPHPTTREAEAH